MKSLSLHRDTNKNYRMRKIIYMSSGNYSKISCNQANICQQKNLQPNGGRFGSVLLTHTSLPSWYGLVGRKWPDSHCLWSPVEHICSPPCVCWLPGELVSGTPTWSLSRIQRHSLGLRLVDILGNSGRCHSINLQGYSVLQGPG